MMPRSRSALRREQILDAALRLADRDGLEGLTVRSLCAEVGVSAPILYRHFADKDAIVHALIARLLSSELLEAPRDRAEVRAWLRGVFLRIRNEFLAHPQLLPLSRESPALLTQSLRLAEVVLEALAVGGLAPHARGPGFHALIAFTIGSVLMIRATEQQDAKVASVIADYPQVLACGPFIDPRAEAVYTSALDVLLQGLGL